MYPISTSLFLDFPFLIAPSVYSNVCLSYQILVFLDYPCLLSPKRLLLFLDCPVFIVPNITGFLSWLPLRFTLYLSCALCTQFYCFWICPVLIAPSFYSNVCLSCTQYYQCFWIFLSWLPLRFTLTFVCPVSCVPNITSVSGLSCLDCPFGLL